MLGRILAVAGALALVAPFPAATQGPPSYTPTNLQFFPKNIPQDQLVQRMREFSFALGVRCEYCHVGADAVPMNLALFASDEKVTKQKARAMLRMVEQLNSTMLAALPARVEPRVVINCATCHRGLPLPKTLQTTLYETVKKDGAQAAVARYRELRQGAHLGRYNFGEREINELARRLAEDKDSASAITILELNGEFYPKSAEIDFLLGELHRGRGETEQAIGRYRSALEKAPQHQAARRRLEELEKK